MEDWTTQLETPAFVIDEKGILETVTRIRSITTGTGCHLLYALKALSSGPVLRALSSHVAGFAASSPFEARLARSIIGQNGSLHITTPGFRPDEIFQLNQLCDYVALNSLSQLERFRPELDDVSIGLRLNPEMSFVRDARFDPCRQQSKLGVPLHTLVRVVESEPAILQGVDGLHFHSNCDSSTFQPLLKTVRRVRRRLEPLLRQVSWVNLGGGYLFPPDGDPQPLLDAIDLLVGGFGLSVFIEPGAALVRPSGCLVARVIDLVEGGKQPLAYLDTTVNHMPEVYEYQYEPDVQGHTDDGRFWYRLVGSTCLAGDVFGLYGFHEPLHVGDPVVFSNMGAYTAVKAHMFNGINLPNAYLRTVSGELVLTKRFTYQDFAASWGEEEADARL